MLGLWYTITPSTIIGSILEIFASDAILAISVTFAAAVILFHICASKVICNSAVVSAIHCNKEGHKSLGVSFCVLHLQL